MADRVVEELQKEKVQLLRFWPSLFCLRVEFALSWKRIEYETIEEDLSNKSPLLLESNPVYKKVPVLIHGGRTICESSIIVQYIDETWSEPERNLLSSDPYGRAIDRFWVGYIDEKLLNAMTSVMKTEGDEQKKAIEECFKCLETLEKEGLGKKKSNGGPFFGGERLGLTDMSLGSLIQSFEALETVGSFTFPWEARYPKLWAWMQAFQNVEEMALVLPNKDKYFRFVIDVVAPSWRAS